MVQIETTITSQAGHVYTINSKSFESHYERMGQIERCIERLRKEVQLREDLEEEELERANSLRN